MPRSTADADAVYTSKACDLGDERKTSTRLARAKRIEKLARVETYVELAQELLERAENESDHGLRVRYLAQANALLETRDETAEELRRYRVTPVDAHDACLCQEDRVAPEWLNKQGLNLED